MSLVEKNENTIVTSEQVRRTCYMNTPNIPGSCLEVDGGEVIFNHEFCTCEPIERSTT